MSAAAAAPEKAQVQRLVAYGYDLNCSQHFVLRVRDAAKARKFLAELHSGKFITSAAIDTDGLKRLVGAARCPASIGFTFSGLQALGLAERYLRVFEEKAKAYAEGARARAAQRLGDTGSSAVDRWDKCFERERAHILLSLHADEPDAFDPFASQLMALQGADGLDGWDHKDYRRDGCHLEDIQTRDPPSNDKERRRFVHFGFRDGIANPGIEGFHVRKPGRFVHKPGEFLLGYRNDNEFNPWLLVNPWQRPNPWLLPLNRARDLAEFFRDGSFAAFRQIEQYEEVFRSWVKKWSDPQDPHSEEAVKAKIAGRWADGRVVQVPEAATEAQAGSSGSAPSDGALKLNDFDFLQDLKGQGCPFGAHIRRMNPRTDGVVPRRRRPLIRRGMPYGPRYVENENPPEKRGLLGLFFCASLEDQFEFLISEWGNAMPMGPGSRGVGKEIAAKDPFIANHQHPKATFDIPMPGERRFVLGEIPAFIRTRGTLYAFYPSLETVRRIANRGEP